MEIKKLFTTVSILLIYIALCFCGCGGDGENGNDENGGGLPVAGGVYNDGCLIDGWQLPDSGVGYYHALGCDAPGTDNWGTADLIYLIQDVSQEWIIRYSPGVNIGILDMSLQYGGLFQTGCRHHSAHQNGLDVDVRYVRLDNAEDPVNINDPVYDQDSSKKLMELFLEFGAEIIFSSDTVLTQGIDGVNFVPAHEDHFHVRLPHYGDIVPCP